MAALLLILATLTSALAQQLTWLGNTTLTLTGVAALPTRGAFVEPAQTVSVTTQTFPISQGQSVTLLYTTDNWKTTQQVAMAFDHNVGNNSQWYVVLGPLAKGTDIQFYLRANTTNNITLFDNNGGQNFAYISRYQPRQRQGGMLQWFATDYKTIMHRLPEVVQAGYGVLYLPPPTKAGAGALSVGYNPMDRFDLGDRLQAGSVRTQYGTTQDLQDLIKVAKRLGLEVYTDLVFNHNDNRATTAITGYPNMIPEDFHIHSSTDTTNAQVDFNNAQPFTYNTLDNDVIGLADIAQEDGNQAETGPFTLPSYAKFNSFGKPSFLRDPLVPYYYPFNRPVKEDVRQYLKRWAWWLTTTFGFDGFRLDAVRHTPPSFFASVQTQPGPWSTGSNLLPYLYSFKPDLFVFGEDFTSSSWEQREYLKTGMNLLDFPLVFNLQNLLNSKGFGSIGNALSNPYGLDPPTGLPYEHGGLASDLGVSFLQSHDNGPPQSNNLGYAFILTRPGSSIVYYDGNNLDPNNYSQFPKPGRYDALGVGGDTTVRLVDARARFGRGGIVNRYQSDNLYVYERQVSGSGVMLVGLNIRGDYTALSATVQTGFAPGTLLMDLSGQMPNITVAADSTAAITVPSNSVPGNSNNARGYVVYAPQAPSAVTGVEPVVVQNSATGSTLPYQTYTDPPTSYAPGGSYRAVTVTTPNINLNVTTDTTGVTAVVRVDNGAKLPGTTLLSNTPEGLADNSIPMSSQTAGSFSLPGLDVSSLVDGIHLFRVRVFADTGGRPGIFKDFYTFLYIDRAGFNSVNGDLTKYSNPLAYQQRTPSSGSNHLDALFVSNDDRYLYIGLAGAIDKSENFTNGLVTFLDTDPGAGTGLKDFSKLTDDSGPAGRLLSHAQVTAPPGFGAEFALASFRGATLNGAPEAPFVGGLGSPYLIGAQAGLYWIDASRPLLHGAASVVSYQPRSGPFGPMAGLEVAIPIQTLYPQYLWSPPQLGIVSYLCTTGETGTILPPSDPNRGILGGRPAAVSWVTNQFLPVQSNVTNDPGRSPVAMQAYSTYTITMAHAAPPALTLTIGNFNQVGNTATQTVDIVNNGSTAVPGPFYLVVHAYRGITLTNATGPSLRQTYTFYILVNQTLAAGQDLPVQLSYSVTGPGVMPLRFELEQGPGVP